VIVVHIAFGRRELAGLTRSNSDEVGYRQMGGFYWVIGVAWDRGILWWVSDDFFIYEDEVSEFEVDEREEMSGHPDLTISADLLARRPPRQR
jgi:hypothetical protein